MIEKITARFSKVTYQKGDFCIASFIPIGESAKTVPVHPYYGNMTVKGTLPSLKKGDEYEIHAIKEEHPKYGVSYVLQFIKPNKSVNFNDSKEVYDFLKNITSEARAKDMVKELGESLKDVFENRDIQKLCSVKGVGERTAQKIIEQFDMHKDYSQAYIELGKYDIPPNTIRKVVAHYKSVEKAIEMIRENPYALVDIDGYGFKKCDELYLKIHEGAYASDTRIKAYIKFLVTTEAYNNGNTWTGLPAIVEKVARELGSNNKDVSKVLGTMIIDGDFLTLTNKEASPRISHKQSLEIEAEVAIKLVKLIKDNTVFKNDGLQEMISASEKAQGWEFTSQQVEAIKTISNNKVILLEGLAGSGKSTSLKVVLDFYEKHNYTYAQTALSGKASSNLALITGKEGRTIHRLLGIDFSGDNRFLYNKDKKLPYDIIIVDEISMVDASIFKDLIVAMRDTAKLILVGDSEQLEAIGIPVMKPLIDSGMIPRIMLTEIHRQAKKSAIVTHSIAYRKGIIPKVPDGISVHGELKDLTYNMVNDDEDIKGEAAKAFLEKVRSGIDIMDVQIISPMKSRGSASCFVINTICQKIYNGDETKKSVPVTKKGDTYILREGDKVINVKNNYSSKDINNRNSPVFNGSIGILKQFTKWYDDELEKEVEVAVIDFEGIGQIVYEIDQLDTIELAYCITIHKSQGMGVPHVIVAYPFAYTLISRQSLYTAITRTKEACIIVIERKTFKYAINKDATKKKRTHLAEMLKLWFSRG